MRRSAARSLMRPRGGGWEGARHVRWARRGEPSTAVVQMWEGGDGWQGVEGARTADSVDDVGRQRVPREDGGDLACRGAEGGGGHGVVRDGELVEELDECDEATWAHGVAAWARRPEAWAHAHGVAAWVRRPEAWAHAHGVAAWVRRPAAWARGVAAWVRRVAGPGARKQQPTTTTSRLRERMLLRAMALSSSHTLSTSALGVGLGLGRGRGLRSGLGLGQGLGLTA